MNVHVLAEGFVTQLIRANDVVTRLVAAALIRRHTRIALAEVFVVPVVTGDCHG